MISNNIIRGTKYKKLFVLQIINAACVMKKMRICGFIPSLIFTIILDLDPSWYFSGRLNFHFTAFKLFIFGELNYFGYFLANYSSIREFIFDFYQSEFFSAQSSFFRKEANYVYFVYFIFFTGADE